MYEQTSPVGCGKCYGSSMKEGARDYRGKLASSAGGKSGRASQRWHLHRGLKDDWESHSR